jgi:hypothetical protein
MVAIDFQNEIKLCMSQCRSNNVEAVKYLLDIMTNNKNVNEQRNEYRNRY